MFAVKLRRHRHLILLVVTVLGLTLQPLMRARFFGAVVLEALGYLLLLTVFLSIFAGRGQRSLALALGITTVAANVVGYVTTDAAQWAAVLVYHATMVLFLGLAVGVILRGVFQSRRIEAEQILGGICGYLLAGIGWSNLYLIVYFVEPGAFNIAPGLVEQLATPESRRFLFNYFSFVTLATVGYGDITPLAPAACALAWLEAFFGQFYIAVLIGQLIGMRLAQRPVGDDSSDGPDSSR